MKPRDDFEQIVDRVRYSVRNAQAIAHDHYWNGRSFERNFRNTWLYKTPKGRYFAVHLSLWPAEFDRIEPLTEADAYYLYENLPVKVEPVGVAFPHYDIKEA